MVALCAILLLAPEARGDIEIVPKTFTISGNIGISGVTLRGFPGSPPTQTDENGVYSVVVEWGWDGTVQPTKLGYNFTPSELIYKDVKADMNGQDYTAAVQTFTISGSVGQPGVRMNGFPEEVVTGADGRYTAKVDWGMTYTVVPELMGWQFEPPSNEYKQVKQDYPQQNYKASEVKFTIAGSVSEPGVKMDGFPGDVVSGPDGRYSAEVRYGFTGTVTPTKEGCEFTPSNRSYGMIGASQLNEDYSVTVLTYDISGSAGQPGVTLKGFPETVVTDQMGYYRATVRWGWDGTVQPEKAGWTFTPPSRPYKDVTASQDSQDYNPTRVYLTIEGSTGVGQATLSGFPGGDITSDTTGKYRVQVEYDWAGAVTVQKEGYQFTPADKTFAAVTQNLLNQNFKADKITYEISGAVQPALSGVILQSKDLPKPVVVGADGFFKFTVDYGWNGTLTPVKSGYTIQPPEYTFQPVFLPQMNMNFVASVVQHAISGKVALKDGTPVADVLMVAEGTSAANSVPTDASGAFEVNVDHGWTGKITPQNPAYIFSPPYKPLSSVGGPLSNQAFLAEMKMLTISDVIKYRNEPIQDVVVTAAPGDYSTKTDATGVFRIKVPYGWTGELSFFKEEFNIMGTKPYENVTEDIDETKPKPVTRPQDTRPTTPPQDTRSVTPPPQDTRPVTPPPQDTRPTTPPQDTKPVTPPQDTKPVDAPTAKELVRKRLDQIQKEIDSLPIDAAGQARMAGLMTQYTQLRAMLEGTVTVDPRLIEGQRPPVVPPVGPTVVAGSATPMLHSVLAELAKQTNTRIGVDLTVKDEPIGIGAISVQGLPMNIALQQILDSSSRQYMHKVMPDGTYLVYHPITNTFIGQDIRLALQDIAAEAEVAIIPDPNVGGETNADFKDMHLEGALARVLAGTPYVAKRMDDYYLVADRSPDSPAFPEISVTRYVRTNNTQPQTIKDLLPLAYQRYVQAEAASVTDPNNQGHYVTITAPEKMAENILEMVRSLDQSRKQVMLDARVVVMERGNMLNLGVEWGFPTLNAGMFYDGTTTTKAYQIGYSPDQGFTNSLMATLNLLEATNQADIVANPQLVAQDGSQAQLRTIQEEWFMMSDQTAGNSIYGYARSELEKIESGTVLTITPYIGDNNDITLKMAIEVSDSIPRGPDSDLPIVTRRQSKNEVTVHNGGTVAVAGLTETRGRNVEKRVPILGSLPLIGAAFRNTDDQKSTREVAVFVTATLVERNGLTTRGPSPSAAGIGVGIGPGGGRNQPQTPQRMTQDDLAAALRNSR